MGQSFFAATLGGSSFCIGEFDFELITIPKDDSQLMISTDNFEWILTNANTPTNRLLIVKIFNDADRVFALPVYSNSLVQ